MQYFDIREIYKDNIANILTKDNYMIIRVSYANDNLISKKQYTNLYVMKLVEAGFKETLSNDFSRILRKDNIIINIMYETNYISIVYREE